MTKDEVMQLAAQYGYACHECHGLPEGNADTEAYWRALDDAVRQLQAENEALRKDAERYRPVAEVHESPFNGHRWIKGAGGVAVSELPLGTLYAKS
jgi:plasmid stabilization system protein ParE